MEMRDSQVPLAAAAMGGAASAAGDGAGPGRPRLASIDYAVLEGEGACRGLTPARRQMVDLIERELKKMSSTSFNDFDAAPELAGDALAKALAERPALALYEAALDKILREVPETPVPAGTVAFWHLYDMGYVVKTPETCFGIDIHHRRARLLAPLLGFCLTTHNHRDHYTLGFLKAMQEAGKPVVSNFYPAPGFARPPAEFALGDVALRSQETDHNATLRKFMAVYEIGCGQGEDACRVYHSGDTGFTNQLDPQARPDVWIVHPRVGASVPEAAEKFRPRITFFSHLWEMGHCPPSPWRPVTATELYATDIAALQALGLGYAVPLWGEKIVWTADERR